MPMFVGADLLLQSVVETTPGTLRVRFTQDPLAADDSGPNDALNTSLYTLTGPTENAIVGSGVVTGDPQAINLFLAGPLTVGTWVLTASSDIETVDGDPLQSPLAVTFQITAISTMEGVNQGALTDTPADLLRKHLNPGLKGEAWDAIIEGIATGDQTNLDNARYAFDQLFTSTASGAFLTRRASDMGVQKPFNIGMPDDLFRQYAIRTTNAKLTEESILEVLEVFYGVDSVRAYADSAVEETFALEDGDDLIVLIDEQDEVTIQFQDEDFALIGLARAIEVAAAINRAFRFNGLTAYAVSTIDPELGTTHVRIYSGSRGLGSSVRITGGKAQTVFQFPTLLETTGPGFPEWDIVLDPSTNRLRFTPDSNFDCSQVHIGDYVTIYGSMFDEANRGSYEIVDVYWAYPDGINLTQWFEVENRDGVDQADVEQLATDDLMVFAPTRRTIHTTPERAVMVASLVDEIDIVLPATSQAVGREATKAAYGQVGTGVLVSLTTLERIGSGLVTVDTVDPHGLVAGGQVFIDNVWGSPVIPDIEAGSSGLSEYSKGSIWSDLDAAPFTIGAHAVSCLLGTGRALVAGGDAGPDSYVDSTPSNLTGTATHSNPAFTIESGADYDLGIDERQTMVIRYTPTGVGSDNGNIDLPNTAIDTFGGLIFGADCSAGPVISMNKIWCRPGETISFRVANGPGTVAGNDFVGIYYDADGIPSNTTRARVGGVWAYLNGTQVAGGGALTEATVTLTPKHEGKYYAVFHDNDTYNALAYSPVFYCSNTPIGEVSLDGYNGVGPGSVKNGEYAELELDICNGVSTTIAQQTFPAEYIGTWGYVGPGFERNFAFASNMTMLNPHAEGDYTLVARINGFYGSNDIAELAFRMDGAIDLQDVTNSTNHVPFNAGYYQNPTLYYRLDALAAGYHTFQPRWKFTLGGGSTDGASTNNPNHGGIVLTIINATMAYQDEAVCTGVGTENLTSNGTWFDIATYPTYTDTFVGGNYTLVVKINGIYGNNSKVKIRVLLDDEPLDGDSGNLPLDATGAYACPNFVFPCALTGGTHTFKLQWMKEGGGNAHIDGYYAPHAYGSREFILFDRAIVAQDDQDSTGATETITSTTFVDVANSPTWTVTPGAGQYTLICIPRGFQTNGTGNEGFIRVMMDGVEIPTADSGRIGYMPLHYAEPVFYLPVTIPDDGPHTFKIQARDTNVGGVTSTKFFGLSGGVIYGSRMFALMAGPPFFNVDTSDSVLKFEVSSLTEQPGGELQAAYTTTAEDSLPGPTTYAAMTVGNTLSRDLQGKAIMTGGTNSGDVAISNAYSFDDTGSGVWTNLPSMNDPRMGHTQTTLADGRILVTGGTPGGRLTPAVNTCEIYDRSTNSWTVVEPMIESRCDHEAVLLADGRVLVIGGRTLTEGSIFHDTLADVGPILATCEIYDPDLDTWTKTGRMAIARIQHKALALPDGRVLVIGGIGFNPTQPAVLPQSLREAELWLPTTGAWQPAGRTAFARNTPIVHYLASKNKVLVTGGDEASVSEMFDPVKVRWKFSSAERPVFPFAASVLMEDDLIFSAGGLDPDAPTDDISLYIPNADSFLGGGLNGIFQVEEVLSATQFTYRTPNEAQYTLNASETALVTPVAAPEGEIPGPFIFDPDAGLAVMPTEATTAAVLAENQQYASIEVDDATEFPDEPGWLVFGFGYDYQVAPVRYFGRLSDTVLSLDFKFRFPSTIPAGSKVTLLAYKGAFIPENPEEIGSFYITDSPAGRVAASNAIDKTVGAGIPTNKTITYPGDRGLGGEGLPSHGSHKLSDKVSVWAGSEVDAEVAKAREE